MKAQSETRAIYAVTPASSPDHADDEIIEKARAILAARLRKPGESLNAPASVLDFVVIVSENANHASQKRQTRKVDIREHKQTSLHLRLRSVCAANNGTILSRQIHEIHYWAPDAGQTPWPLSWWSSRSQRLYLDSFSNTSAPHKTRVCKTSMASYGRTPWALSPPRRASSSSRSRQTQRPIGQPCLVGFTFSLETPHARSGARPSRALHLAPIVGGAGDILSFAERGLI